MVFFLIVLLLIIFAGVRFSEPNQFNVDYLNKSNTTSVNGIFVILIVISHFSYYMDLGGVYDAPYMVLKDHLRQMVVASFWFYSGFGMMESIRNTNFGYIEKLPSKFWQLLLRADVAVLFFCVMNAMLGIHYPKSQIAFSFIYWKNVGNSSWYIFDVLVEYILIYASFKLVCRLNNNKRLAGLLLTTLVTIIFIWTLMKAKKPTVFYDTVIILPIGMAYSEFRGTIEKVVQKNDLTYLTTVAVVLGIYFVSFFRRFDYGIEGYTVWAISYIFLLILITMKISIRNEILEWFGKHIFSIYIIQRIPMHLLNHYGCTDNHKYMSLVAVFAITMPLALMYENLTKRMINRIEMFKAK